MVDSFGSLGHSSFLAEHALDLVHQAHRQMACSSGFRFCVLGREVDNVAAEGQVFELDPDELAHSAAKLVNHTHHQLVAIMFHKIKELLKFFYG